jgi:hypothetical protein
MKVPVDYNIGYEGGTFCTQVIYEEEELPRVGGLEKVLIDGKERLVEITKIAPMVVFAGSARVPIGGKIVPPEAKPFVRFLNRKTGEPVDVVTSAHTDATYHLYKVGDRVALNAGGVSAVRSVTRPTPSEIVFFCD